MRVRRLETVELRGLTLTMRDGLHWVHVVESGGTVPHAIDPKVVGRYGARITDQFHIVVQWRTLVMLRDRGMIRLEPAQVMVKGNALPVTGSSIHLTPVGRRVARELRAAWGLAPL